MNNVKTTKTPAKNQTAFGPRLRAYIQERGIKQSAICDASGIRPQRFTCILGDRARYQPHELIAIACFLRMTVDDLLHVGETSSSAPSN